MAKALLLLMLGLAGGCPPGRDPPPPMTMIRVPAGSFTFGPNRPGAVPPACGTAADVEIQRCDSGRQEVNPREWIDDLTWVPPATATLAEFEIDLHEVTNLEYEYCVERGACTPPVNEEVTGVRYFGRPEHARSPVVWVTHQQAMEYCAFVGKTLPNEAQWERAARLDVGGIFRTYPWAGTEPSNCVAGSSRFLLVKGCRDLPQPVDYTEADRNYIGVRGMASNVSEWVLDGWNRYAYCERREPYSEACQLAGTSCAECASDGDLCAKSCDPQRLVLCRAGAYQPYLGNSSEWVVRGGSWNHGACYNRLYVRRMGTNAQPEIGFRCASWIRR